MKVQNYKKAEKVSLFHPEKLLLSHNRLEIIINNALFDKHFRRALAQRLLRGHYPQYVGVAKEQVEVVATEEDGFVFLESLCMMLTSSILLG